MYRIVSYIHPTELGYSTKAIKVIGDLTVCTDFALLAYTVGGEVQIAVV